MNSSLIDLRTDIRKVVFVVLTLVVFGLVVVLIQQRNSNASTATLWSLAFMSTGALLGFLFGIPRVLQGDGTSAATAGVAGSPGRRYQVNTNLEQVSDWITKILVGLGLIELQQMPARLKTYARLLGLGLGTGDNTVFAGSIIVYFLVVGFMGGYLLTRLFLARLIADADVGIDPRGKFALLISDFSTGDREPKLSPGAQQAAAKLLQIPLAEVTEVTDIVAWAKAQFSAKNFQEAVAGYQKALMLDPNNVQIRLELATALYRANKPAAEVESQLLDAYRLMRATLEIDAVTKMKVYRALTYHYLFQPPPEGYTNTIKYGLEYCNDADSKKVKSGGLFVNLACAYGQQFKWLSAQTQPDQAQLNEARNQALQFVKKALEVDVKWRDRLLQLLRTDITKPPGLNDLEVFAHDPAFREVLGLG